MASRDSLTDVDQLIDAIDQGPSGKRVGAFFDLDGTIVEGYTAATLYKERAKNVEIGPFEAAQTLAIGLRGISSPEEFQSLLDVSLKAWRGRSVEDLDELGERLFRQHIAGSLFPEAYRLIRAHVRAGHTIVIASSATRFQVEPVARELGIDHCIYTPVEVERDILTGRVGGDVPYGPGKAAAITAFAKKHKVDLSRSYGYSNDDEDVPMLETVAWPCALNPDSELERVATTHGWPVAKFAKRSGSGIETVERIARTAATYSSMLSGFGTGIALGTLNRSRRQSIDLAFSLAGDIGMATAGIELDVIGSEHLWSHRPAVFVFNHQSSLVDALILFKLLRGEFTAVAKMEAKKIPFFGQFFRFADVAFVDRGNTEQAKEALEPAVEKLRDGISLVMSPEGTRSYSPGVGRFKKGAFHVAMQAGVPIVPMVVRNAGELMWRNSKTLRPGTIQVCVHPPIPTADWTTDEVGDRADEVRELFIRTLDSWPQSATTKAK